MKHLIIFLFLISCSSTELSKNSSNKVLDFDRVLSFDEYKILLNEYNEITKFPDINK